MGMKQRGKIIVDVNDIAVTAREQRNAGRLIAYYRGYLPMDKNPDVLLLKQKTMSMSDSGAVHLAQRRHGDFDYTYFLVPSKRKPVITHAPPIDGMLERRGRHSVVWRRLEWLP